MSEGRAKIINYPGYTSHFTRSDQERKWLLIDAKGHSVGRLATQVASLLRGKHKPTYTRHDDVGDFVIIINAGEAEFRGNDKLKKKKYHRHTGYRGHLKEVRAEEMMAKRPTFAVRKAVRGMIPSGALGNRMLKKLKVYAGPDHPHKAQKPETLQIRT